jgi:DNA polymerase-1
MGEQKKLIIIDSNSIIHRAFHALPPLTTKKGEPISAVYGFLLVFLKTIKDFQPDFIAACFDSPGLTFRHKEFREYKITRPAAPKELYQQIPKVKEILKELNIPYFEKEGFEADDLIGTIAKIVAQKEISPKIETIILTGDLDTLQLVDPQTKICLLKKGTKDIVLFDEDEVKKKYKISPKQLVDFKALRGDPSDNIPGILGIGEKTAQEILQKFENLENLYKELEEDSPKAKHLKPRLKELLLKNKEQAFLYKFLAKIKRNVPIEFDIKECQWGRYDKEKLIKKLKELEFYSLVEKFLKLEKDKKNLKLW